MLYQFLAMRSFKSRKGFASFTLDFLCTSIWNCNRHSGASPSDLPQADLTAPDIPAIARLLGRSRPGTLHRSVLAARASSSFAHHRRVTCACDVSARIQQGPQTMTNLPICLCAPKACSGPPVALEGPHQKTAHQTIGLAASLGPRAWYARCLGVIRL